MTKYYSVVVTNKTRGYKVHYLADSFSVNDDRLLRINSKEWGNVMVELKNDDVLLVNETVLYDIYDDRS